MQLVAWLSVVGLLALGAMSPGPSLAVVMTSTLRQGRRGGIQAALGHATGVTLYAAATVFGLASVLLHFPIVASAVRYGGACVLLYLAYRTAFSSRQAESSSEVRSLGGSFASGMAIALLNPKMAVFFLALFSQFIRPDAILLEKNILVATSGLVDASWFVTVASLAGSRRILEWIRERQRMVELVFATLMIVVAVSIVV